MSNLEKLKKKAADFEQKKQYERALEIYVQVVEQAKSQEDRDVPLYNRIGDLYLRIGKTEQAVTYYEQAVDLYAEGGYLNNAIALCNKILRIAPSRNSIYYKLGKISAQKGFNSDAKKNFLEYADRMHKLGRTTDAFKALEEFADLCPGQDDIRLMLAEQLARAGKKDEAVEQLQILHVTLDAEGRTSEAEATVERMRVLDPNVQPRRSNTPRSQESGGLVFLDLEPAPRAQAPPPMAGLEFTSLDPESAPTAPPLAPPILPNAPAQAPPRSRTPVRPAPPVDDEVPMLAELEVVADEVEIPEPIPDLDMAPLAAEIEIQPVDGLETTAEVPSIVVPDAVLSTESALDGVSSDADDPLTIDLPHAPENYNELVSQVDDTSDPLAGLSILEDVPPELSSPSPSQAVSEPVGPGLEISPDREARREAEPEPLFETTPESDRVPAPEPATAWLDAVEDSASVPDQDDFERADDEDLSPLEEQVAAVDDSVTALDDEVPTALEQLPEEDPVVREEPEPVRKVEPAFEEEVAEEPVAARPEAPSGGDDEFVDLADWLREDTGPRSTRMIAADEKRVGDEQADFADMLEKFKAGVAANVEDEDFDSHYDLGIAYREMGLLDEAISEFQKALRGSTNRIRAYEALGQCFIDREEHEVAVTLLSRGLREPGLEDEELIGVLYLLGYASEEMGHVKDAASYYQRVFAIDIDFRDVRKRLGKASKAASR